MVNKIKVDSTALTKQTKLKKELSTNLLDLLFTLVALNLDIIIPSSEIRINGSNSMTVELLSGISREIQQHKKKIHI